MSLEEILKESAEELKTLKKQNPEEYRTKFHRLMNLRIRSLSSRASHRRDHLDGK